MYKTLKSPIHVNLEITSQCNNKCLHCYNYWRESENFNEDISFEQMQKILESLIENEVLRVAITGGEPFIRSDIVFKVIETLQKAGIFCGINSNLTIMTPDIASKLRQLKVGILTSLLSYDKDTHDHIAQNKGAFDRTIQHIKMLQEIGVPLSVNMVVMQENAEHVYLTGKFVHDLGIKSFTATKVEAAEGCTCFDTMEVSPVMLKQTLDDLLRLHKEYGLYVGNQTCYPVCFIGDLEHYQDIHFKGCGAGINHCTIGANGEVRACPHTSDFYGNALTEPLSAIWAKMFAWRDGSYIPTQCKSCEYLWICTGGCRAASKFSHSIDSLDPYAIEGTFDVRLKPIKTPSAIRADERLYIPPLKLRKEAFGVVVVNDFQKENFPIVTEDSAFMLKTIQGRETTLSEICQKFHLHLEEAKVFFGELSEQRMVFHAESN